MLEFADCDVERVDWHWRLLNAWNLLRELSVLGVGLFPAGSVSESEAMW